MDWIHVARDRDGSESCAVILCDCVADTAVVEQDVLNNIGLATLAEVAAAKKKLAK